jgi:hypothetical protein
MPKKIWRLVSMSAALLRKKGDSESTNLLHAFSNSDSHVTIIAEVRRQYATQITELVCDMYVVE